MERERDLAGDPPDELPLALRARPPLDLDPERDLLAGGDLDPERADERDPERERFPPEAAAEPPDPDEELE